MNVGFSRAQCYSAYRPRRRRVNGPFVEHLRFRFVFNFSVFNCCLIVPNPTRQCARRPTKDDLRRACGRPSFEASPALRLQPVHGRETSEAEKSFANKSANRGLDLKKKKTLFLRVLLHEVAARDHLLIDRPRVFTSIIVEQRPLVRECREGRLFRTKNRSGSFLYVLPAGSTIGQIDGGF